MTYLFVFLFVCFLFGALAVGGHKHRWQRGDDWRERYCEECGERQYLFLREWIREKSK